MSDFSEAEGDAVDVNASVSALNAGPVWGSFANVPKPMPMSPPVAVPSVGSRGDAYDNAMAEAWVATLKSELIDGRRFPS